LFHIFLTGISKILVSSHRKHEKNREKLKNKSRESTPNIEEARKTIFILFISISRNFYPHIFGITAAPEINPIATSQASSPPPSTKSKKFR
jgi:hypothetical protein